jgi:cyclic-di-GMP-binding protein
LENNFQATHCAAAYTTLLLIDIASPYSNNVRNLNMIRRWASMWAPLISIHQLDDDLEIPPYFVEFSKDAPLHPSALVDRPGDDARRLDTTRLGLQINHMLSQLRQRISPSQLGLGEETSGYVTDLLERLSRPWTQSASPRKFRRFPSEGIVRVAVGFDAMHFFITGKEFEQPVSAKTYTRSKFDQLFTFGDRVSSAETLTINPSINFPVVEWSVINHSANGFRLACKKPTQHISHGQLLAIHPHDGEQFLLAQVNWSMQEASGEIIIGIAVLPGIPHGIGVRFVAGSGLISDHLTQAFLLPPIPAFSEDSTLILPSGMYHSTRILDVLSGNNHLQVRMRDIVQRGTNFDRVAFEALQVSSSISSAVR